MAGNTWCDYNAALSGEQRGRPPLNVTVVDDASHDMLMAEAAAVITHGGPGTVIRSLVHGVPLLCMPMGRDQHDNTARVAALGADLTVDRNWGLNRSATAASFPT